MVSYTDNQISKKVIIQHFGMNSLFLSNVMDSFDLRCARLRAILSFTKLSAEGLIILEGLVSIIIMGATLSLIIMGALVLNVNIGLGLKLLSNLMALS